jgi:hypothetical protein
MSTTTTTTERGHGRIIRTDGTEEPLERPLHMREIAQRIGAGALDTVTLHHLGHPLQVMCVDDAGWDYEVHELAPGHFEHRTTKARKAINAKATALYLANCVPGTTHQIAGDVAIVFDDDFA